MKGIILAGGSGTRLYPATIAICKQLLPIYDKPMIYYPLATLMSAGIHEILIISTPKDTPRFQALLGDGSQLGIKLHYAVQKAPNGIAEAISIAEPYFTGSNIALILGDNLFFGESLPSLLKKQVTHFSSGAVIFGYHVQKTQQYGVLTFDENGSVIGIEEKPQNPQSNYAVSGLYLYDRSCFEKVQNLQPSKRGELEITDLNVAYLGEKKLRVQLLERGIAWLDTGTMDALQKASSFVQTLQERQGLQIACIEEIAYRNGWIDLEQLSSFAHAYNNQYSHYISRIVKEENQKFSSEIVL
jgi:glucose-1-phosphate thymidylyltransferase